MPLNTTLDQKTATVRLISRFGPVKLRCVMSGIASAAAGFDRSVMILIPLESVESQFANRYIVCADQIIPRVLC